MRDQLCISLLSALDRRELASARLAPTLAECEARLRAAARLGIAVSASPYLRYLQHCAAASRDRLAASA
ncbi:MAG: hypothetical protein RMM29_03645 [Planctomycetota bacterium]|nr:hypothetical protein [Planctomycetota bacterium]MCX8039021.1 hypothetical protein [Planctomycetota bacterium]MDW8372728.1 hypothetical protein [Planctomycetota bacterium]